VPGVAVGGEQASDRGAEEEPDEPADDAPAPGATPESDDDGGLRERIPAPDTDIVGEEKGSVVKTYGLLGLGVSMVMLGIATVGIWVYRRRTSSDGESETPPPATGLDTAGTAPTASEPESPTAVPERSDRSIAEPDERDVSEPQGRVEADRSDVEWEPRDTAPASEPAIADEPAVAESVSDEADEESRPTEPIDAAPLLGAAFLAATGAVVRWLQSGEEI